MTVSSMRSALAEVYSGAGWKDRVKDMPENQVVATYKRMERSGKLEKHNKFGKSTPKPIRMEYIVTDAEGRLYYCASDC